jgi:hypothetical protein
MLKAGSSRSWCNALPPTLLDRISNLTAAFVIDQEGQDSHSTLAMHRSEISSNIGGPFPHQQTFTFNFETYRNWTHFTLHAYGVWYGRMMSQGGLTKIAQLCQRTLSMVMSMAKAMVAVVIPINSIKIHLCRPIQPGTKNIHRGQQQHPITA